MGRWGTVVLLPLLIVALLLGVLLGLDNSEPLALAFLNWRSAELPVFFWILLALVLGVVVGVLCCLPAKLRQRRVIRRLQRQLER